MAKELPYLKFNAKAWLTGDICKKKKAVKGVFIDVIAFYWDRDCKVTIDRLKDWFEDDIEEIDLLLKAEIIKLDEVKNVIIEFLTEQLNERNSTQQTKVDNGKKGGRPRKPKPEIKPQVILSETENKPEVILSKANESNIEKEKDVDREIEKEIIIYSEVEIDELNQIPKPNAFGIYTDVVDVGVVAKSVNEKKWKDTVCMMNHIPENGIDLFIDRFTQHCIASGKEYKSLSDYKQHFSNWIRKQEIFKQVSGFEALATTVETPTEKRNRLRTENQQKATA